MENSLHDWMCLLATVSLPAFFFWMIGYGLWAAFRKPDYEEVFVRKEEYADGHCEYFPYVVFHGKFFWGRFSWKEEVGVCGRTEKHIGNRGEFLTDAWMGSTDSGSWFKTEELARKAARWALEKRKADILSKTLVNQTRL